jgi:hypothetical protein
MAQIPKAITSPVPTNPAEIIILVLNGANGTSVDSIPSVPGRGNGGGGGWVAENMGLSV